MTTLTLKTVYGETIHSGEFENLHKLLVDAIKLGKSIVNADLKGLVCRGQKFYNIDFTGCDLSNSTLPRCIFKQCTLRDVECTNSKLYGVGVLKCTINKCNFDGSKWFMSDITNSTLTYNYFDNADLHAVDFVNCKLVQNTFDKTNMQSTRFINTSLTNNDLSTALLFRSSGDGSTIHSMYVDGRHLVIQKDKILLDGDTLLIENISKFNEAGSISNIENINWWNKKWKSKVMDVHSNIFNTH